MRADARQISKQGWLWQWTAEGHVLPDIDAGHLAARIEDSLSHASSGDVEGLETCWRPLIVEKEAET